MEKADRARLKNTNTFLGRWVFALLLLAFASPSIPANSDPCHTGYWSGSTQDVSACARLARSGGPNAEFGYALILWSGHKRPENRKAALYWFRKSARQGHHLAQAALGRFLSDPSVAPELRDPVEAYAWWTAAGATSSAAKLLATLSPSDARRATELGEEYKAKYAHQRPPITGSWARES